MNARLSELADGELLARFDGGDVAAFGALLERYRKPIYNFILRFVSNPDTAADLLQDTFARVIQGTSDFRGNAKISTWMHSIARNLCVDHLRKQRHRRHASLDGPTSDDGAHPLLDRVASDLPNAETHTASTALRERITRAVESLPDDQREVFLLRQVQQLPFAQIAEVVGAPENTVKSRMRYALERLQSALADYEEHARAQA